MLNTFDREILKKDEIIFNLENQVKILKGKVKSLTEELDQADDEINDLEEIITKLKMVLKQVSKEELNEVYGF